MKKKFLLPIFASFMLFTGIGATSTEAATPSDLVTQASKYIGVKYSYGGTSVYGFDCSGYTQFVFKQLGISLPRTASSQFGTGTAVTKANLQVGDLVFFNTTGKTASHVGIYIGNSQFIHAGTSTGVTIASINSSYWSPKFNGGRRVASFTTQQIVEAVPVQEVQQAPAAEVIDFSIYASRGEVAIQLAQLLGLNTSDVNTPFPDVDSSSKYAGAVNALYKERIFSGDNYGYFNPNAPLTREQMAKILVEAFGLQLLPGALSFADVTTDYWSYNYINILSSNQITNGVGNGLYAPTAYVKNFELDLFVDRSKNLK